MCEFWIGLSYDICVCVLLLLSYYYFIVEWLSFRAKANRCLQSLKVPKHNKDLFQVHEMYLMQLCVSAEKQGRTSIQVLLHEELT